jgi:hemerythrin
MDDVTRDLLAWTPEFDLGNEEIDLQHHYFLNLINRLHHALRSGGNHENQVALLKELNAYVKFHFISEENMMRFANYDRLFEHQRHHYELIDQLNARESGLTVRYNSEEADEVVAFLVNWFKDHTTGEDKQFAEFLHRQRANA